MNHIENLEILIKAVEAEPELNLGSYRAENHCGTLHCVAGLLPTIPHFRALGIGYGPCGEPVMADTSGRGNWYAWAIAGELFGCAFDELFAVYGGGNWDNVLGAYVPSMRGIGKRAMTDKELALARLNKALTMKKEQTA